VVVGEADGVPGDLVGVGGAVAEADQEPGGLQTGEEVGLVVGGRRRGAYLAT
jgi:hypothetical protein